MKRLRDEYANDPRVTALSRAAAAGTPLVLGACHGGLLPVLVAAWASGPNPPRIVVTPDPRALADDLEELGIPAALLPELDRFTDDNPDELGLDRAGHNKRMAALEAFAGGSLLVASPLACEQPVPDIAQVVGSSIVLKIGQTHDMHQLMERLVAVGYQVKTMVEGRGEAATRGGIIDVFPWIGNDPYRIEFFGDQVDAIRRFDAFTQESIAKAEEAVLASAKGGLAVKGLWAQLPPGPIAVVGDTPLRSRLKKDHGRAEIRLARQLEDGAVDGAGSSVERLKGDLRRGLGELAKMADETAGASFLLFARNGEAQAELAAHLKDAGLTGEVRTGRLSAGFRDGETGLIVVHDYELSEREPVRRRVNRIAGGSPLSSLNDLKKNDLVVHLRHGIGRFLGMATLEKRGFLEDFLLLEFAQETKLYVPVEAIDQVQKWIGGGGRTPELSIIGGTAWAKKRARAEKAVEDISGELLEAQAKRLAAGGIPLPPDGPEERRFAANFPFEETEDQLAALREITADLERPVAMDRLLCGDVGFGKTEVAIRAAFKVAHHGYQVILLAPTTLLAEQHYETLKERFRDSGFTVAGLNRFHAGKERREILAQVTLGKVSVLVGTHALLSDDLKFHRLGLLIIDEEHRFGVKQKERLRSFLRAPATTDLRPPHVLTLSATPIPRTLHFSMLGLRDISVLAEPPAARLAVETRVGPWDDETVRHALLREQEREGQVFVVHHRVSDLDQVAYRISKLVPGLRLDTIHGQMDVDRIARVMDSFRNRQIDCLVATSIVESGIDVPNANTLIVTNAHHFGLAELHQIRGRVGRFTRQAYAYFLTPAQRELGQDAAERLDAIQEYAELGAGFKLAMRDLELRGAGNLLGSEQSGQIDAIGYELYAKMLNDAVEKTKRGQPAAPTVVDGGPVRTLGDSKVADGKKKILPETDHSLIGIKVDAYIPDTWLETPQLKFELHKAIDGARTVDALAPVARTARDRFGAMPPPVLRLFRLRAVRLRTRALGIGRIDVAERQIRLHLTGGLPKEIMQAKVPEVVHIQPDGPVLVLFLRTTPDQDQALSLLCKLLALDLGWLGAGF